MIPTELRRFHRRDCSCNFKTKQEYAAEIIVQFHKRNVFLMNQAINNLHGMIAHLHGSIEGLRHD